MLTEKLHFKNIATASDVAQGDKGCEHSNRETRPVSYRRFSQTPANSVLSCRQPTHIG